MLGQCITLVSQGCKLGLSIALLCAKLLLVGSTLGIETLLQGLQARPHKYVRLHTLC